MGKAISIFLLSVLTGFTSFSQDKKLEREYRIKPAEAPLSIHLLLTPYLSNIKKLKFYKETDIEHESYEAKFYWNGAKYSVEFTRDGILEDIEVNIDWQDIGEESSSGICTFLSTYKKNHIEKIQRQFSSEKASDEEVLEKALNNAEGDIVRYEIVTELKVNGSWVSYELLFDLEGVLLSQKQMVKRSTDFILY